MQQPTMYGARRVDVDTFALESCLPVPGMGVLAVNAFVVRAEQPVLIDTGLASLQAPFLRALAQVLDPSELHWIWLTHADADHVGNLAAVLRAAPQARVVTNFLGMGKLGLLGLPTDRVHVLNAGGRLDLGDRALTALMPPAFDAPETLACFDGRNRVLFSADCFGGLLAEPATDAAAVAPGDLRDGITTWSAIDAPWLPMVDDGRFGAELERIRALQADTVLSSHLPPARGMTDALLRHLDGSRRLRPTATAEGHAAATDRQAQAFEIG
jgi:glyoxylase-like metal-dependent hydrolase (beta-lactamase superfamily II)